MSQASTEGQEQGYLYAQLSSGTHAAVTTEPSITPCGLPWTQSVSLNI